MTFQRRKKDKKEEDLFDSVPPEGINLFPIIPKFKFGQKNSSDLKQRVTPQVQPVGSTYAFKTNRFDIEIAVLASYNVS